MTDRFLPQFGRTSGNIGARSPISMSVSNLTKTLGQVPLFRSITEAQAKQIASQMVEQTFSPGQTLFSQGDPDTAFYLICNGEAEVLAQDNHSALKPGARCMLTKPTRIGEKTYPAKTPGVIDKFDPKRNFPYTFRADADGARGRVADNELNPLEGTELKTIALLRVGDYCGEQAILKQSFRAASVRASVHKKEPLVCAVLSREKFLALDIHHLVHFPERKAVRAADLEYEERVKSHIGSEKTAEQKQWLKECILKNPVLMDMGIHLAVRLFNCKLYQSVLEISTKF